MKHFLLLTVAALTISLGCSAKSHKKGNYHYCSCHGTAHHPTSKPTEINYLEFDFNNTYYNDGLGDRRSVTVNPSLNDSTNKYLEVTGEVLSVAKGAFKDFSYVENIFLTGTIAYIHKETFKNCVSLKNVNVPNHVNGIGKEAFYYCYNLNSIVIPASVKKIGARAFYGCNNLNVIIMNKEGQVKVGKDAFAGCKSVSYVGNDKLLAYNKE